MARTMPPPPRRHSNPGNFFSPGPQVIWLGLRRMIDFALAWKAFLKNSAETCV